MRTAVPSSAELDQDFKVVTFQADSALLRELGERLVGQPHIALAELIKNAYDADATLCTISIDNDEIVVTDNGHGMTSDDFFKNWMTIGTRNKQDRVHSQNLKRDVTGSKGVGRLSAQFLAHTLEMVTVSRENSTEQLRAFVDWNAAIDAGTLMNAKAFYKREARKTYFPGTKNHGTSIVMKTLKQEWNRDAVRDLGRQLWMIQSPIQRYGNLAARKTEKNDFRITLSSPFKEVSDAFDRQMNAALENNIATISGELKREGTEASAHIEVEFRTGERYSENFEIDPLIEHAKWHIKVFNLSGRQSGGIDVATVRKYFEKFGGVQVYDANFRLPYYGIEQDWLGIEYDHSHRKNRSNLLPERLQVRRALNDLPTQGRIFGVVSVDTGREARKVGKKQKRNGDFLKIQITRDRLVANQSYQTLRNAVRWSLDYYATRQRLKEQAKINIRQPEERAEDKLHLIRQLANSALESHPKDQDLAILAGEIGDLSTIVAQEREAEHAARTLLGPLASAGMAALALEHENRKEIRRARRLARRLWRIGEEMEDPRIGQISGQLKDLIMKIEEARKVFAPLMDEEDRREVEALAATPVLEKVIENVRPLVSGMRFSVEVPSEIYFPAATFAEWNSLFQNLFLNASNATLDKDDRQVLCLGGRTGRAIWIRVEDNGFGVDRERSDELFEPFKRFTAVSEERRALGLGGNGLGLTIVRTIAAGRRVRVGFVRPSDGWSTAFQLSWGSSR